MLPEARRLRQLLGGAEHLLLLPERFLFPASERRIGDLIHLETEHLRPSARGILAGHEPPQALGKLAVGGEALAHRAEPIGVTAKGIYQAEVRFRLAQCLMLVLAVDADQAIADRLEDRQRGERSVQ